MVNGMKMHVNTEEGIKKSADDLIEQHLYIAIKRKNAVKITDNMSILEIESREKVTNECE